MCTQRKSIVPAHETLKKNCATITNFPTAYLTDKSKIQWKWKRLYWIKMRCNEKSTVVHVFIWEEW